MTLITYFTEIAGNMSETINDNSWGELRLKARILLQLGGLLTAQEMNKLVERSASLAVDRPDARKWLVNMIKVKVQVDDPATLEITKWPATVDVRNCTLFSLYYGPAGEEWEGWVPQGNWIIVGDVLVGRVPMVELTRHVKPEGEKYPIRETRYVKPDYLKVELAATKTTSTPQ